MLRTKAASQTASIYHPERRTIFCVVYRSGKDIRDKYTFTQEPDAHDIKLRLFGKAPSSDDLTVIANEWFKGQLGVSYSDIPIYIVVPPKEPAPKPKRDRRFVRKLERKR